MITIQLNNGASFEATSANETYSIRNTTECRMNIVIEENMQDVCFYQEKMSEEGALDVITISNASGTAVFNGFTEIRSIDRGVSEDDISVRIVLVKPDEAQAAEAE